MNRARQNTSDHHSEAGFTLVETAIAMVLTGLLLQLVVSSTLVLNQSSRLGHKRVTMISRADLGIRRMYFELGRSSLDPDPDTGADRIVIGGVEGDRTVTFRRVVDFADQEDSIVSVWSSPITYRRVGLDLQRTQDGKNIIVLHGVSGLDLDIVGNRVRLRVTVQAESDAAGALQVDRELSVHPAF